MADYILKYGRDDRVKFISHLDFVRCFHRAVRRSKLNFVFSQGFNPHPVMTIALPLPVGMTSECDFMKVGFATDLTDEEIMSELNNSMPPGFKIYGVHKLRGKEIDINKIDSAEYITEIECDKPADVSVIINMHEVVVPKKTKSGIKDSDIRPHIFGIEDLGYKDGIQTLKMRVSCGNAYNLKPETVVDAMEKYCEDFKPVFNASHKKQVFINGKEIDMNC